MDAKIDIGEFAARRVVVIGDIMLDEFVRGDVARISPEAPVPILEVTGRESTPGGAANAANNVRSLGASVALVGLVGADAAGDVLVRALGDAGIDPSHVLRDPARPTTHKTRIVARGQQVVRIDQESREPVSPELRSSMARAASSAMARADACIISDYGKGVVSPELVAEVVEAARARKVPVIVDPKRRDFSAYRGATVITPNLNELELATGARCHTSEEVVQAGGALLEPLGGAALLVTRGAAGMTLLVPGEAPVHTHARARAVFDVTGAGDTVVGALALALATGTPLEHAIEVASVAAGLVVSKVGTATVTAAELASALDARAEERGTTA